MSKIVYIAGKITGNPNYESEFIEMQGKLERDGFMVLNPALITKGIPNEKAMPICMEMIIQSDGVGFLKNWGDSFGARMEQVYAEYTGKEI